MSKRGQQSVGAVVIAAASIVAACSPAASDGPSVEVGSAAGALSVAFVHAAEHAVVPRDLLVAIARVEDGLELPARRLDLDEDSHVPAAGPLMLRHGKLDTLARGAVLAGVPELALRQDADLALSAGAMVLAELGAKTGARSDDLASWSAALQEMSGYVDDAHREEYAHRVFATLARGGKFSARDGETIVLAKHDLPPTLTLDISGTLRTLAVSEYPGAEWIPTSCTNKCTVGRAGNKVEFVVIHDTEGGWDASAATLQNDPGKSVQYMIGTDGRTAQFVTEDTTAYHAGNFHYNQRSIGIEHVGYSTKPYTEANYVASAKLVNHLTKKYGVPKDRAHIIGHDQIPNGTRIAQSSAPCSASPKGCESNLDYGGAGHHTDPGVWEWPTFMERLGAASKCNDVTALWNCSNDKKKAFRCEGGKAVVATCDGACVVKPNGQDDLCNVAPASTPPPIAEPTTPAPGASDPTTPPSSETTGSPLDPDGELAGPPAADSGCSVTRVREATGSPPFTSALLLIAGVVSALRRRRRAG